VSGDRIPGFGKNRRAQTGLLQALGHQPSYTFGMDEWNQDFLRHAPMLAHFKEWGLQLAGVHWPDRSQVQKILVAADVRTASGSPLQVVEPRDGESYEVRVFRSGELEFRENNWHDLFNALAWIVFPKTKAALNARHHQALVEERNLPGNNRGRVRDALTLLDESGVIVASADPQLLQMIREFRWKPLFWERRLAVSSSMYWLSLGHALCEKALAPYRGMTGHGLLIEVGNGFFALNDSERAAYIDRQVAELIADPSFLTAPDFLSPIPVLGIPGWHDANSCAEFYDDHGYFRPGRRGRKSAKSGVTGETG